MRFPGSLISALLLATVASSSSADVICSGHIMGVFTDRLGRVTAYATFRNDWVQVCNVTATWKNVPVDVCKAWVATLTTLRISQEPVAMYYTDYTNSSSCLSIPTYDQAPSPHYISINLP